MKVFRAQAEWTERRSEEGSFLSNRLIAGGRGARESFASLFAVLRNCTHFGSVFQSTLTLILMIYTYRDVLISMALSLDSVAHFILCPKIVKGRRGRAGVQVLLGGDQSL